MILPSKDTFYPSPPSLSHLFFFSSSFLPSFSLCFFLSFVREGFPRGRGRFTERTIYNRKGSRISSTVGRKIRYRFPSSKLSTLVRVGGKARDAIRPTGNSLARLRFLLCCLETLGAALPRVRAPFYEFRTTRMRSLRAIHTCIHWEQEQERKQDRRRVGTWRERELRAPRCGTMRSLSCTRTLLYENQVGRSFRTGNGLRGEEDGSVFSVEGDRG